MVGDDHSFTNALCQIITIASMHYLITLLKQRFPKFGLLVDGTPLVLFEKGRERIENMNKMRILYEDVAAMVRDQGLMRFDQIDYAVLERNGEISVIPSKENS
jgi:uncharacterized membrane protein YcaP (DUF421 family)